MSSYSCFMVLVSNGESLLECAISFPNRMLPCDFIEYPMGHRGFIFEHLPLHVRSYGTIVRVEPIFEVCIVEG